VAIGREYLKYSNNAYIGLLLSLFRSARGISGMLSLDKLKATIVDEARRVFEAQAAWLLIYDHENEMLRMSNYLGPREDLFKNFCVSSGVGIPGKVFLTQKPVIISGLPRQLSRVPIEVKTKGRTLTLAAFPLTAGDRRIGVFGMLTDVFNGMGLADESVKSIVSAFANHAATTLDTAMLFEEKREVELELKSTVQGLHMLNEIGSDLVSDLDLSVIMYKVVNYAAVILGVDAAFIMLRKKDHTSFNAAYFYNIPSEVEEALFADHSVFKTMIEKPHRVLISDYQYSHQAIPDLIELGVKSFIAVPVIAKGMMLAVLSAVSYSDENAFTESDFDELEFVARQVAIAIENASLYQEQVEIRKKIETYANQLRVLNIISNEVISEAEIPKMATRLSRGARALLDCSAVAVLLYKGVREATPVLSWSTDDIEQDARDFDIDLSKCDGLYGEIFRTQKPIRVQEISSHPKSKGVPEGHPPLRGLLGAPLLDSEGRFLGHVMATDKKDGTDFSETDEELLVALCAQVSIGIEKAKAYEREHRIAEALQQAILAVPDKLPGVDVGIIYESAAEAAKVGGDFYDLFELGDGEIGVLIGDVSGKGLEAATITSMVKSTIRAFAYKGFSPARILTEANKVISRQLGLNQFVTMVYGVLEPDPGRFIISRAGHPELIILCDKDCSFCESESNLPLGIIPDAEYEENEIMISPGENLILFTDGLTEAKCEGKMLGEEALAKELSAVSCGKNPQEIALNVVDIAKNFSSGKPQDDIAVVVLRLDR